MKENLHQVVDRLLDAYERGGSLPPITDSDPSFDLGDAYDVLAAIESRRHEQGWRPVGRKIGFTNRTLWEPYGVDAPMWARVWDRTVLHASDGRATITTPRFPEPRIEPEVVFGLRARLEATDDPRGALDGTAWIAPGFEIVWSPFPGWRFALPDCTAAFGLHGLLVVGTPHELSDDYREHMLEALPACDVTLSRDGEVVDRGVGANVLGGPAHALAHLTRVLASQPGFDALGAGEIVTTGTITDAWPIEAGQTWTSDYGTPGLSGLTVMLR